MSESFAELFEESLNTIEMAPGSIVTGTVVEIDTDWVVVHAGLKSEGLIPRSQFVSEGGEFTLAVGDQVKAYASAKQHEQAPKKDWIFQDPKAIGGPLSREIGVVLDENERAVGNQSIPESRLVFGLVNSRRLVANPQVGGLRARVPSEDKLQVWERRVKA